MKAPLVMPESGMSQQSFEPQRIDYAAPEAGGRIGGVQAGFPLWAATWTVGTVGQAKSDEIRSFLAELRGAIRWFYGRDLARPYPKQYPEGFSGMTRFDGSAFDGSATSWSQSVDANADQLLTLHGLPSGLTLGTLDYVGFKWTATDDEVAGLEWRALVRVVRGGGGPASAGGDLTVKVEPAIPSCVPAGAVAHLDRPSCVMKQVTDQTRLDPIDRRLAVRGGTIVGIQDLRA